jgi:hypothetical protein
VDRVGALLWEVCLRTPVAPTASLKERAERLSQRITGLLEPLSLVEVDADASQAQLRSSPPRQHDDQLAYYELLLKADAAELRRFQVSRSGGRRQQIAFSLTHDCLAKLVSDLTAPA